MRLWPRWAEVWERAARSAPGPVYARLVAAYGEPHRAYHTLAHIIECLEWFDRARHLAHKPDAVELALWFHDVVYNPPASDNEMESAAWAARELADGGAAPSLIEKVSTLIQATTHDTAPDDADARLLLDIDLAILGAPPNQYATYARAIRQEYGWLPASEYAERRAAILRRFLAPPPAQGSSIYLTPWFRLRLETRARDNLQRELGTISQHPSDADGSV